MEMPQPAGTKLKTTPKFKLKSRDKEIRKLRDVRKISSWSIPQWFEILWRFTQLHRVPIDGNAT